MTPTSPDSTTMGDSRSSSPDLLRENTPAPPSAQPPAPSAPTRKRRAPSAPPTPRPHPPAPATPLTAEAYNRQLLSNPSTLASSALSPDFLTHYFTTSRLHHLSTWKTTLRARIASLPRAPAPSPPPATRWIMHLDFDCFFAAVSLLTRPHLRAHPVAITHGSARSASAEIACANYVARSHGVRNGDWVRAAREKCPALVCLPYEFAAYERASTAFYGVLLALRADALGVLSVDEALVEVSSLVAREEEAEEVRAARALARSVAAEVRARTGCEVSVGVARNVLLARLALRKAKPAGVVVVAAGEEEAFLDGLALAGFPGVGKEIARRLHERFGSDAVRVLRGVPRAALEEALGKKTGARVWEYCRGIDDSAVGEEQARQSVSVDVNWGIRFYEQRHVEEFLRRLVAEVVRRLAEAGVVGRVLTVKLARRAPGVPFETEKFLGCGKCEVVSRSVTLGRATACADVIAGKCLEVVRAAGISPGELRGMGVAVRALESAGAAQRGNQLVAAFARAGAKKEEARPAHKEALDPDVLAALPDDIRAEILAQHGLPDRKPTPPSPAPPRDPPPTSSPPPAGADFDPAAWNSLPRELRAQLRAEHAASSSSAPPQPDQAPPSSPSPPPSADWDVAAWNSLPRDLRAQLRAEHEASSPPQPRQVPSERAETPPSANWDAAAWNALPAELRQELRREHAASQRTAGRAPAGKGRQRADRARQEMWSRFLVPK